MASDISLPELGENVEGGTVVEVHVSVGDAINEGQTLLEVEAGKGTVEVPSPLAGKVAELLVGKGDEVTTGQVLLRVEGGAEKKEEKTQAKPAEAKPSDGKQAAAEKQTDGKQAAPAAAKETDGKQAAPAAEKKTAAPAAPDTTKSAPTAQVVAGRNAAPPAGRTEERPAAAQQAEGPPLPEERPSRHVPASPATRRLARELGVDIGQVPGSANHGRVTAEDVKGFVRQLASGGAAAGAAVAAQRLPDFSKWGTVEAQPLSTIRHETARHMALAWSLIPHVTQHDQADVTDLDAFRRAQPQDGPRLTVTAFALKAAAIALRQFPQFNSTLDLANRQLLLKKYYHVGVAVDTDRGLLVPVVRDVDKKSIQQLAEELGQIAERARNRKIGADDMSGGTFTITNLGGIGGTGFTPIVNYPEVAILGLSRARLQPMIHQDQVAPRLILPLSLSYDHRAIDGADAARFTRRIAEMLENPWVMLLHV